MRTTDNGLHPSTAERYRAASWRVVAGSPQTGAARLRPEAELEAIVSLTIARRYRRASVAGNRADDEAALSQLEIMMGAPPRFYLLDVLRGLASFSVVVWHYQGFFMVSPGVPAPWFSPDIQPLYNVLWPFYTRGYEAVQLFFSLSGFTFFYTYGDVLAARKLRAYDYFILRFSRLYPLHFATLLCVAVTQWVSHSTTGNYIGAPAPDAWDFLLQLFLASSWGLGNSASFNTPIWSVSIEILLYAVFFAFACEIAPRFENKLAPVMAIIVATYLVDRFVQIPPLQLVARAAVCFFSGGIVFLLWDRHRRRGAAGMTMLGGLSVIAFLISLAIYLWLWPAPRILYVFTFPALILALACAQTFGPDLARSAQWIGDMTYSTYLIHYPLYLAIMLAIAVFNIPVDFRHPAALLAFVGGVALLSIPIFHRFELPLQRAIRSRWLVRRRTDAARV